MFELIAFACVLNIDTFCAAFAMGARRFSRRRALSYGASAALSGALAIAFGFVLGDLTKSYVGAYQHWAIFLVLGCIGARMISNGLSVDPQVSTEVAKKKKQRFLKILLVSIATSIDNAAVGVTLSLAGKSLLPYAFVIGSSAFVFVLLGLLLAKSFPVRYSAHLETLGGILLVGLGLKYAIF
jgi:putative Mn2+ efflux pump MntP